MSMGTTGDFYPATNWYAEYFTGPADSPKTTFVPLAGWGRRRGEIVGMVAVVNHPELAWVDEEDIGGDGFVGYAQRLPGEARVADAF